MLNNKQKTLLRSMSHKLKPVVMIGSSGLSENVISALEEALDHHELIKVKVSAADRKDRDQIIDEILEKCVAEKIQRVGNMVTIYRRNPEKPAISL